MIPGIQVNNNIFLIPTIKVKGDQMKTVIIIFLSLMLYGCASTFTIKDFPSKQKFYDNFNNSVRDKNLTVTLMNKKSIEMIGAKIKADTLFSRISNIPITDVNDISYKNHLPSTIIGFFLGTSLGIITGLIGYGVIDKNNSQSNSKAAGNFLTISSALGLVAGIITGWLSGFKYIYQFNP